MLQYTADELWALRRYDVTPPRSVRKSIFSHRLWCPFKQRKRVQRSGFPRSRARRAAATRRDQLIAGFVNIRSVHNKLDDLLDVRRDRSIDLLCLAETWHDDDCVGFSRLRAANYSVVDRPRPRVGVSSDLSTNHVAVPGINLSRVNVTTAQLSTFEHICVRATSGQFAAIIVVIYRPGSSSIQSTFFDELSSVFDVVATFQEAVYVAGDFNVHLDRCDDSYTKQFTDLLSHYGFSVCPTTATHQAGGTIDAVVTRCEVTDLSSGAECQPIVSVNDVGLSDHHLLIWSLPARKPSTPTQTASRRPWRQLDVDQLREQLKASTLCQPDKWPDDIDDMAAMYESELNTMLDCLIPSRVVTRRPRPSDPWFDDECREAKRLTRRLERAYSAVCRRAASQVNKSASADVVAAKTAWYAQRRNYRDLRRRKSHAFWCDTVESERASPSKLWRSVNLLLGRGKPPASSDISVDEFISYHIISPNLLWR